MPPPRPAVLVVAGSDSSGGAGLQRDLRVLADLDVDALTAVTAVTAQTDHGVRCVLPVPAAVVRDQVEAALGSGRVRAVKVGMLAQRGVVDAVADALLDLPGLPVVVDPVLASSSGSPLLDDPGRVALVERLLPLATLLTPNLPEAAALLGEAPATDDAGLLRQARLLLGLGPGAVLLKGGHGSGGSSDDLLVTADGPPVRLRAPRLAATMRGTGCALATGIAARLAQGRPLRQACALSKASLTRRLARQGP